MKPRWPILNLWSDRRKGSTSTNLAKLLDAPQRHQRNRQNKFRSSARRSDDSGDSGDDSEVGEDVAKGAEEHKNEGGVAADLALFLLAGERLGIFVADVRAQSTHLRQRHLISDDTVSDGLLEVLDNRFDILCRRGDDDGVCKCLQTAVLRLLSHYYYPVQDPLDRWQDVLPTLQPVA